MTHPIQHIFLDLDGVMADFVGRVAGLYGHDPATFERDYPKGSTDMASVLGVTPTEMWRTIDEHGDAFWAHLAPYPWASELYDLCVCIAPTTILTSPPLNPQAAAGKVRWMNTHLTENGSGNFRDFLIGPDKVACARPGALLIDDRASTCRLWRAEDGMAIVFPRVWNLAHRYASDPMAYVKHELRKFGALD